MNRIERLNAILLQLQSKRVVRAQEIAERFGISTRTVYRDIRAIEAGGVPITGEAGLGYSLDKDYSLPPVHLESDEVLAMLIAGKLILDLPDETTRLNYQSALSKIRAILPHKNKDKLERWETMIKVMPSRRPPELASNLENISIIQQALLYSRLIHIDYYSHYRQQLTERTIEPIGLLYYAHQWHLIAWCQLRVGYRDFRLDRIKKIEVLNQNFKTHRRKNINEYLLTLKEKEQLLTFTVCFHQNVLPIISEYRYNMGYLSEKRIDQLWMEMDFVMADIDYFARWLLMYTDSVRVVSPPQLVSKMKQLFLELNQAEKNLSSFN